MKIAPIRIIAALLLVVALLSISGVASATAAYLDSQTVNSCCDSDCDAPPAKGPCSTPDCPCFSCATMIVSPHLTVQRDSLGERLKDAYTARLHPFQFSPTIEYPPETA